MSGMRFSSNWNAVRQRIRRLPQFAEGVASSSRKRDAHNLVSYWRTGLRSNSLGLAPLKPRTVQRKSAMNFAKPNSPLYGLGLEGVRTYIKGLRVFKTSRGFVVRMIDGRHHSSKLSLKSLFIVHEYGTTINRNGTIIRIPPRPAFLKSYQKVMNDIYSRDPSLELRKATMEFLRTGFSGTAKAIESRARAAEARNNG